MQVALFRIAEAAGGRILIDGVDIASLGLTVSVPTFVSQEVMIKSFCRSQFPRKSVLIKDRLTDLRWN